MATKPINVEATLAAAGTAHIVGALSQWLSARQQWAPLALRLPARRNLLRSRCSENARLVRRLRMARNDAILHKFAAYSDAPCSDRNRSRIPGRPCATRRKIGRAHV